ncbi:polysaccharide deacetylase family protein [Pseudoalteromonas sp. NZS71_1]|uniref:polysaccharide deacetylase family protein n=1 Tax=Pseudoalteromonas sp. NZS71_1 TaxID=2792072 RepID=UPI0018CC879C|nr:polysaccharide deacetylase family protein [Pseudoalteromonas sp. NZS71_1]MBH0036787.1 polysaccharide deacetylase family protein [Pseudoalteromonas sp. NZS71_1]
MSGKFIISLDFEKSWGFNDIIKDESDFEKFVQIDNIVNSILELFDMYSISATWAVVTGMIKDNEKKYNLESVIKHREPEFQTSNFISLLKNENINEKTYTTAIEKLLNNNQEVASHSHTHIYLNDVEIDESIILEDLKLSNNKIKDITRNSKQSIVFPRNQITHEIINKLPNLGFSQYRGTNSTISDAVSEEVNIFTKIIRVLDSYVPLMGPSFSIAKLDSVGMVNIPASRYLRIKSSHSLNLIHLSRVKAEMTQSAKKMKNYHLWWHPHNFTTNKQSSLYMLNEILKHYEVLKSLYGYENATMAEVGRELNES